MRNRKGFRVSADEIFQQVAGEVANHIPAYPATNKAHLLNVASTRNGFLAKISKETVEIDPESLGKVLPQGAPTVPMQGEA
jgi:hypothetical protein